MPRNNCIRIALDLKDKNILFDENFCEEKRIKGFRSKVYYATLTYQPSHCECCGMKNHSYSIVKNGYLTSRVKWVSSTHYPTYIQLKKHRFLCRECGVTFVAQSPEIEQGCFIAKRVKQSIAVELADTTSVKDLSKRHFVSPTTTDRVLKQLNQSVKNNFKSLPQHLSFDEFKSVKNVEGKMSFIYSNADTHEPIDILPTRLLTALRKHFLRYPYKTRMTVKTIVVDMNAAYFTLVKDLFPNAKVIIDRFHIIQLLSRSLNQTRVQLMKRFNTSNSEDLKNYRKFKRYWQLLLKDSDDLNFKDYRYQRLFKKPLPNTEIVDYLLTLDETLKATYDLYQNLLYYSKKNDYKGFKDLILKTSPKELSPFMQTALKTLRKHLPRIKHTFMYPYSNGALEGSINKIKVIKRVAYGYRNFQNFRCRILISFKAKKNSMSQLPHAA